MKVERPLDFLNESKGKEILVELKDRELTGTLLAFDIHINLVLDNMKLLEDGKVKKSLGIGFVRGDTIVVISPAKSS